MKIENPLGKLKILSENRQVVESIDVSDDVNILIVGESGTGKSSTLSRILRRCTTRGVHFGDYDAAEINLRNLKRIEKQRSVCLAVPKMALGKFDFDFIKPTFIIETVRGFKSSPSLENNQC